MELIFLILIGFIAGGFGSLLGLGGGIIMVPAMTLIMGFSAKQAVSLSLMAVAAGSTGASINFLRTGRTDLQLGLKLETITTIGAVTGAIIAGLINERYLLISFAVILLYSALSMMLPRKEIDENEYFGHPSRFGLGMIISFIGGNISGLLGVGGGIIKVPVMNLLMGVPLKIASATSSYMIGITASTSAIVYLFRGDLYYGQAPPVILGILAGSQIGARISYKIKTIYLKWLFSVAIIYTAVRMLMKALQ